jgi:hypothetical protein
MKFVNLYPRGSIPMCTGSPKPSSSPSTGWLTVSMSSRDNTRCERSGPTRLRPHLRLAHDAALAAKIGGRVHAWTGNRLEPLVLSLDPLHQLAAANEPIVRSWIEEPELLMGRPLATLLADKDTVR